MQSSENNKPIKPLGRKAYGSIPHLPGSRVGPGDYHIHEGQAKIATVKTRDKHDVVIVQEKLDGGNVAVAKVHGEIVALTRSGYIALDSPYEQHHLFHVWVYKHYEMFDALLNEDERICGEWLAQAHGTRYALRHQPFAPFDIFDQKNKRLNADTFLDRIIKTNLTPPFVLHRGGALPIDEATYRLGEYGYYGATDNAEGVVYRVERNGVVDFLAKYVRSDKVDGKYLPEKNGSGEPIWNLIHESAKEAVIYNPNNKTGQ